jgi:hypothetical protein
MSNSASQPEDLSPDEISRILERQVTRLDPERAAFLSSLQQARAARGAGYARERQRLTLKYGPDDRRVFALSDKARFNDGLRRDLDFEAVRAGTEAPTVDQHSYIFHGFVRDRSGNALPSLTVALYDSDGQWLRAFGHGCTDTRGYFLLRNDRQRPGAVPDPKVRPPESGDAGAAATTTADRNVDVPARVYVFDGKGTPMHIEKEPLHPQLGNVDYRLIILGKEGQPCAAPPDKQRTESAAPSAQAPESPGGTPPTVVGSKAGSNENESKSIPQRGDTAGPETSS